MTYDHHWLYHSTMYCKPGNRESIFVPAKKRASPDPTAYPSAAGCMVPYPKQKVGSRHGIFHHCKGCAAQVLAVLGCL